MRRPILFWHRENWVTVGDVTTGRGSGQISDIEEEGGDFAKTSGSDIPRCRVPGAALLLSCTEFTDPTTNLHRNSGSVELLVVTCLSCEVLQDRIFLQELHVACVSKGRFAQRQIATSSLRLGVNSEKTEQLKVKPIQ